MRRKTRRLLSIFFALIAVVLCFVYGKYMQVQEKAVHDQLINQYGGEKIQVLVAKANLSPGDTIKETNTELREWSSEMLPVGALTTLKEVKGKPLTSSVARGAVLSTNYFDSQQSQIKIPDNKVGITLNLDEKLGIDARIQAGSKLCAYSVEEQTTRLIAEDITVLNTSQQNSKTYVHLALAPTEVESVLHAQTQGSLRFVQPGAHTQDAKTQNQMPTTQVE